MTKGRSKFSSFDFSQRILIIVLCGFMVSTVLITVVILQLVQNETKDIILKHQQDMSKMAVARLDNTINARKMLLEEFTHQLSDGDRLLAPEIIQKKLDASVGLHHYYNGGMLVLDANAVSIADSPVVKGRSGIDFSDRAHVKAVRQSSATVITKPAIGRGLKTPVFAINTPIKVKSGKIVGFLLGVTRLADSNLFQEIGKEFLGGKATIQLIEPNLRIYVTASDPSLAMQKLPPAGENPIIDKVLAGSTSGFVQNAEGQTTLFAAANLNLMPIQVIHSLPESGLLNSDRRILVKLALLIISFTLLIALAVYFLLRRQLMTLRNTSNLIGDMVEGKKPYQALSVDNNDEIGQLIIAFNRLQQRLSDNIDNLEQSNEQLEKHVEQRTFELKGAMLDAERANAAKSEFLSSMSHELRTPLNAVIGFAQLLELDNEGLNQTQQENVREIINAGTHLLNLINEVLDLARIESGKIEISMEKVNVNDVFQQSLKLLAPQIDALEIEVIDKFSYKDYVVHADFTRLKQVVINLITNAMKYNCVKGCIVLESAETDNQRIRISVRDTGNGLSEEDIDKLFTPFERLNAQNSVEGTGIGLVIAKHWIELMGGTIGVESNLGEGSTFWIELELFNIR